MEVEYRSVLDEITDDQRRILKDFRESLDVELNHRHTDELLVKFLRAKNFNLKGAKKIFLETYYSKMIFGLNTILDTYQKPEVAEKFETANALGFAKDGTLLRYMAVGRLDLYGFGMSMSCFELCVYFCYIVEQDIQALEDESLKTGKNVTEVTIIADLEGFSLQQVLHKHVIEMGMNYIRLMQDCYPDIFRRILIVNAPKVFQTAFNIFSPLIRSAISERIHFIDKGSTKDTLLKYVDEDVLPAFLGGSRVDSKGDPMCREFVKFGGKIPEKFYSHNCQTLLSLDDPEVKVVNIGARSTFNVAAAVHDAGTTVRLQARTEGGSISLCLLYKEFGPDPSNPEFPGEFEYLDENSENFKYKQITVDLRDQIHCAQEDINIFTPWPGIYVGRFSNASSWFTPRRLYYKVTGLPKQHKSSS